MFVQIDSIHCFFKSQFARVNRLGTTYSYLLGLTVHHFLMLYVFCVYVLMCVLVWIMCVRRVRGEIKRERERDKENIRFGGEAEGKDRRIIFGAFLCLLSSPLLSSLLYPPLPSSALLSSNPAVFILCSSSLTSS